MTSIDQIARIAYEAHYRATLHRDPLITWAALDAKAKIAWIAAVQTVRTEIERH